MLFVGRNSDLQTEGDELKKKCQVQCDNENHWKNRKQYTMKKCQIQDTYMVQQSKKQGVNKDGHFQGNKHQ